MSDDACQHMSADEQYGISNPVGVYLSSVHQSSLRADTHPHVC